MPKPDQALSRRQLLRAAGFTIALPTLASLHDGPFVTTVRGSDVGGEGSEAKYKDPKRFCCIVFPNGVSLPPQDHPAHEDWHWFPHTFGPDYQFTRTLESLEEFRRELTVLSGASSASMAMPTPIAPST